MTRVNLKGNPSFNNGTTHYQAVNNSNISIDSDYAFYGTQSLRVEKSGNNDSGVVSTDPILVTEALPYACSAYVRLPNTLPAEEEAGLVLRAEWRNSVNTVVSINESSLLTLDQDDTWERLTGVWVAPPGATYLFLQIVQPISGEDGAVFLLDAVMVEQASYVGGFVNNISQDEENRIVNKALTRVPPQTFNGMALNADVMINDLILNTIDEAGTVWVCTDISGWWGNPNPEIPDIPRGTEDGSYDVSGRYQARVVTLTGTFIPSSVDKLGEARDRLISAINLVRKGGWLRTNETPTKAAFVRLSGQPQIQTVNARGRTEFIVGLRAGDPVKYEWNDQDPDGYTQFHLDAVDEFGTLVNRGTIDVTGLLTLTGPMGANSTIYNALTDETLTVVEPLRGAGVVGDVIAASVTDGVATLTTSNDHGLYVGDKIIVSGVSLDYDTIGYEATVIGSSRTFPYSVNYALSSDDLFEASLSGRIILAHDDTLTIDTYNREVSFNGSNVGHRSRLETLTDWIKFAPGNNTIEFHDDIDGINIISKSVDADEVELVSDEVHYLQPGDEVEIALPETVDLLKKSLTSNVVTLTTASPHGFSTDDIVEVETISEAVVDQKTATTTEATLRTVEDHGVGVGDTITVNLPETATPSTKSLTSNVATIQTQNAHGFSENDSVTVALPVNATVTNKAVTSNQASLTTAAAHGFSVGDSITVALSTVATVTNKERIGASARLTTASSHGFSIADSVTIALPTSATLTDTRSIADGSGNYLVTLHTSSDHNFSAGDVLTVDVGLNSTETTTNRESSGTTRTLTIGSHDFSVGEAINVVGVASDYNGSFYISAVSSTTISYVASTSLAEAATASSGSVTNITIQNYYNGSGKVIESVPSSTSFTYLAYGQAISTSSTKVGTGSSVTNVTNQTFNGTKSIASIPSPTTFTYNI